ncbi:MAG: hypothetical protein WDW36_007835 [Sanguina aurantia]
MMASTTFQSPSTQHSTDSMNQPYLFASTDHSSSRRQQQAGNPIPTHSPRSGTTHPTNGRSTHGTPSVQSKVAAVGYSGSRLAQPFTAQALRNAAAAAGWAGSVHQTRAPPSYQPAPPRPTNAKQQAPAGPPTRSPIHDDDASALWPVQQNVPAPQHTQPVSRALAAVPVPHPLLQQLQAAQPANQYQTAQQMQIQKQQQQQQHQQQLQAAPPPQRQQQRGSSAAQQHRTHAALPAAAAAAALRGGSVTGSGGTQGPADPSEQQPRGKSGGRKTPNANEYLRGFVRSSKRSPAPPQAPV